MITFPPDNLGEIVHRIVQQYMVNPSPLSAGDTTQSPTPASVPQPEAQKKPDSGNAAIAIGADHGGFSLKEKVRKHLTELGYNVTNCGTYDTQSVDYPDFAYAVAKMVSEGKAWRGIVIDGAGIGSCMVANKVPGVRATMCYDYATAVNSREHNDANVLTLGAGLIGENLAMQIIDTWLKAEFLGGRHARRVDKIVAIEKQFLKSDK
jgi:RpiB/LacA/LacB family sugar-phosphate isomerase